ncbi:hypothetical protein AWB91_08955 [Mycobacterium paraense]|uniref:DUF3846 domain-containing protein n=1 Tax=Mycobacterium paraense TaxID=767916 RepID=A0ABX3VSX4_9MYCO|nr:hypothetical protein AWB91_08955 [Mycobacterium paraense]
MIAQGGGARLLEMRPGDTLKPLQDAVGGLIQRVTAQGVDFWVAEEAKLMDDWYERLNGVATDLLYQLDPRWRGLDVLVGTVVLTGGADSDGEIVSAPESLLREFGLTTEPGGES